MKQDLIQVDGKFYKKCKVIKLDTKDKTSVLKNTYKFTKEHGNPIMYLDKRDNLNNAEDRGYIFQHLYILSDEEIKEGDWFISELNQIWQHNGKIQPSIKAKKIIATTDESLIYNYDYSWIRTEDITKITYNKSLPRPSESFLQKYCELGGIDEVLVEYEDKGKWGFKQYEDGYVDANYWYSNNILKIADDNTITIKPFKAKASWNREEVEKLLELAWATASAYGDDTGSEDCYSWIKENLK